MNVADKSIAMIGLGHVGHPVAPLFGKAREVTVHDRDEEGAAAPRRGEDIAHEAADEDFDRAAGQLFACDPEQMRQGGISTCAAVTPFDRANLALLLEASETAGLADVPGVSTVSGPTLCEGFPLGHSPDRSQTADKHRPATIAKMTSGSTPEAIEAVQFLPTDRARFLGLLAGGLGLVCRIGIFQVPQAGDAA